MPKRWMSGTLAGVLGAAALASGCTDDDPKGGITPEVAPVTVTFWRHDNASFRRATDEAFAAYTTAHPHVTIVPTQVPWFVYTGALNTELKRDQFMFDFVLMPPAVVCGYAANLADVPPDVVPLNEAQNTFFAPPLSSATCNGVLKGLPVEYNLEYGGVIVNLDLWAAKFPTRAPGWATWESFLADASALAEVDPVSGKPCVNGFDIDPDWPEPARHIFLSQILQRGGNYWGPTGDLFNFDTPEARASLTAMVEWITVHKVMSPSLVPTKNTMVTTRLAHGTPEFGCGDPVKPLSAMGYVGPWGMPDVMSQVPAGATARYKYVSLPPMFGAQHRFVQNAGFAFAVPKNSKNARVAWDIIKSIAASPDVMRKWAATAGTLPALKANGTVAAASGDPVLAEVQPLLGLGQWMGYIPAASTEGVLGAMVREYFLAAKGKDIGVALKDMQDSANAAIIQNR